MNKAFQLQDVLETCVSSLGILNAYYNFENALAIKDFLISPDENDQLLNHVLIYETHCEFFLGLQFSNEIFYEISNLKSNTLQNISTNTISIVAEETSHLKLISDAIEKNKRLSLLDIETLGEIDRFLCLMHWNFKNEFIKIKDSWKNLHDVCDHVFQGNRFRESNSTLYFQAENRAFKHLKNAFSFTWDYSFFDFTKINLSAAHYLKNLRQKFFLS